MISLEHANTVAASSRPPGRREKADWKFAQVGTMTELLVISERMVKVSKIN